MATKLSMGPWAILDKFTSYQSRGILEKHRVDTTAGASRLMVSVADKSADVILLREKNIISWLISLSEHGLSTC
jgi:hypothetical protein